MRILVIIIFTLASLPSSAQILKVNKGEIDSDSSNYFLGGINLNFNVNNGSATTNQEITFVGLKAEADVAYLSENNAYILLNNLSYFKSTGGPLISTGYIHFRINYLRKDNISFENYAQVQYDDGRNMPLRRLIGGGIKFKIAETDNSEVHIGTGAIFEHEEWKQFETSELLVKEIWKNSSYAGFRSSINDFIIFNGIIYFQGGLDANSDLFRSRISGEISFSFDIIEKLAFSATFIGQYEDRPIIEINQWVYSYTNGLKWRF